MGFLGELSTEGQGGFLGELSAGATKKGFLGDLSAGEGVKPFDLLSSAVATIPEPVKTAADVATRIPGTPFGQIREGVGLARTAVEQGVPALGQAVAKGAELGGQAISAIPVPIQAKIRQNIARQAKLPFTPIGQAASALKVHEVVSRPSRAVMNATESFLEESGMPSTWAMVAGLAAGAPLDPAIFIPLGGPAKVIPKLGLTAAGKVAAEKTVAGLVARPGEALAAKVPELAMAGKLRELSTLMKSGQTGLAFMPKEAKLLENAVAKTDQINRLWQTRSALRAGTADLVKTRGINQKMRDLEEKIAGEVLTPSGKRVDDLVRRRDDLMFRSFNRGEDNRAALQKLNKQIDAESRSVRSAKSKRIESVRKDIDLKTKELEDVRNVYLKDATDKLKVNLKQFDGLRQGVKEKFAVPIENELLEAIVQLPDKGLKAGFRQSMQNLTFLTSKMDELSNGAFSRFVLDPQITAENKLDDLVTSFRSKLRGIQEKAGVRNDADDRLFRLHREKKIEVSSGRAKQFNEANEQYSEMMDDLLKRYNTAAEKVGSKKIIVPREDYVFHTRKQQALLDLADGQVDDIAKDANSVMFMKRNDPAFFSWKRRYDVIPEDQLAGAFEAADKYVGLIGRYESYGPMVKKFRAMSRAAQDANQMNLAEQMGRIADNMTGDAPVKSAQGLKEALGGAASIGFQNKTNLVASRFALNAISSFSSGINQVAGVVNNAIYGGIARAGLAPAEGIVAKVFERAAQALVNPNYVLMAHRYSKVLKGHMADLPARFAERKGNLVQRTTLEFFKYMNDAVNVGTFNQMYKGARVSGYGHDQAVKIADNMLARTQAVYRDAFRPSVISKSSALGRLVSPLATYVFNAANALAGDVVFSNLLFRDKAKALARVYATGVLVNGAVFAATGKRPWSASDAIPFLRLLEMGPGVFGVAARSFGRLKRGQFGMAALEPLALLSPGGSRQIVQTATGVRAIAKGRVEGPIASAKALVFGPPFKKRGGK